MSIEAMAWVLSGADVQTTTEMAVMIGLANHADAYGYHAFPSVRTLARYVKASERTVQRTLTTLSERGVIEEGDGSILDQFRIPANRRPVVWNLRMGVGRVLLNHPDLVDEDPESWGDNLAPLTSRGDIHDSSGVTPTSPKPYKREPSFLTNRRGAPSSPENKDSIRRVSTEPRPPRKRSGMRRVVSAEEGPDSGRVVGKRGTTEKAIRTHEARRAISRPNSGGGLAAEFGQRASEAGLSGPQEINGQALARNLTRWMHESNNPDSPDDIRAMMDEFFERPGGSEDYPLWRRFLSEAPKLRNTRRKTEPYDYQAAAERDRKWIEKAAASGDVRAQMELSGENRPWLKSS